jgi:hypothetical protein
MKKLVLVLTMLALASSAQAGSIFISGHDADFHALVGSNSLGAQNIINRALDFARNGNMAPILYLQSNTLNIGLGDHVNSELGLNASGYAAGVGAGNYYVKVDAAGFAAANMAQYSAIFLPSDHGGTLTGDDLAAVNARSADLIAYLNGGGGLVAFAEDGFRTPASSNPQPVNFGFMPFLTTAAPLSEFENGNTLTPFGVSLGLTVGDINGNFSHNVFTSTGGMNVVDRDAGGEILSLAWRGQIGPSGVPDPGSSLLLLGMGLVGLRAWRKRLG